MPNNACNPQNAVGKLAGIMEAGGIEMSEGALNVLDDNAKAIFHQISSQNGSQTIEKTLPKLSDDIDDVVDLIAETDKGVMDYIKGGVMDTLKPSDYLPEDVTGPVFEYLDNFFAQNYQDMKGARKQFSQGIRAVIDEIRDPLESLDPTTKGQAMHWLRDMKEGYPFYGKSGTFIQTMQSNVVNNVLDFSGTVVFGNPLEILVKAPSLYGIKPTLSGLAKLTAETKGNLWAKIPELERAGVYYLDRPASKGVIGKAFDAYAKVADSVSALTDRPLKNLAYAIGKEKGNGVEAVEKIAFKNRFGNDPRIGRSNRDAVRLMNYTFNTYYMLASMGKGLLTPGKRAESIRQLGTWIAITSTLGGPAAVIPEPISKLLRTNDEYANWEDQNLNVAGKLIRPSGITFGLGYEILNRVGETWERNLAKGADKIQDGDITGGMLDLGEGGLSVMSALMRMPLSNSRIQRVITNTRDLWEGDVDNEEYMQKNAEIVLPAIRQK